MNTLLSRIVHAHQALRPQVAVTPLSYSAALSRLSGCEVYLKCEHLQHTGSFKFRGASNKLLQLDAQARAQGVITGSTGNHGLAVARAAKIAGVKVTVYTPANASQIKLDAIEALGAQVIKLNATPLEAEQEAARQAIYLQQTFISPYNDIDVIAGQGTIGMELNEQCNTLSAVFASVGGGGLIAGLGTAIKHFQPAAQITGCWPANAATLYASLQAGRLIDIEETDTLSDGTAGGVEAGSITFPLCQKVIDDKVLLTETEIKQAMHLLAQHERWIVEGAAGVAMAGMLKQAPQYQGKAVAVVLCGRNIVLQKFLAAI
ncbi:threonine/serine dehydratase [Iodobacter fluviatilis]|uniref:Threonine dehydratase n=1 Tax=Iodobacter fluviatilis TaxID=537 RepID=A0A377Q7Z9_9NEIS|nr:threonine/serine dehydratase [Iodobacter fluviatilis]TCU89319.1 threonine dehydratase [Iodobacter fluviatilis]STQ90689.1 L-threonine dehydratase catabolic TdcB [Iodobacter fluviatilis]